ncbi:nucleotidyl transferase AbiEii/AbiGii toxin family protein [Sulfurimonas sp.]|uniref:nucleotidyl transferase AbiEii/AbiGii toxin family protein n=1 Tax=Sulfurimonas sp. TaxID=2022749 RepID=UPI0026038E06|nr:nucleotidyl transferase AbiEii/AbiGii toxin family protein [Sulfurimonas sp.]MDD5156816.1 nucleotidyl transferase AbiEii/AbiGii toxin family protein [Sulfurimonas sp.]
MNQNSIYFKQVELLIEVLPHVTMDDFFALKGGTAINLFIRDFPRLSVDIDLMYLPVEPRDESLKNISMIFEEIAQKIEKQIKFSKVNRLYQRNNSELSKLQVERKGVRIKIEASPVTRGTVKEPQMMQNTLKVQEIFGFAMTSVVHFDDLYAGKICAALDRQHPRDFFDVRGLLDNEGISESLMDVFIVYLISSNQPISKILEPNLIDISKIYEEQFVGMTIEPVDLKVLEDTREELISTINQKLTHKHKEFLIGFKKGSPNWKLLPYENIIELPSIKWKQLNLDKMGKADRLIAIEKLEKVLHK